MPIGDPSADNKFTLSGNIYDLIKNKNYKYINGIYAASESFAIYNQTTSTSICQFENVEMSKKLIVKCVKLGYLETTESIDKDNSKYLLGWGANPLGWPWGLT